MKQFFSSDWWVRSSSNPENISLTVKGFLLGLISIGIIFGIDGKNLSDSADIIVQITERLLGIIASVMFTYGLVRKLWKTFI